MLATNNSKLYFWKSCVGKSCLDPSKALASLSLRCDRMIRRLKRGKRDDLQKLQSYTNKDRRLQQIRQLVQPLVDLFGDLRQHA